jgi:hypothetical protein
MDNINQILFFLAELFEHRPPDTYIYIWHKMPNGAHSSRCFKGDESITDVCNYVMERENLGVGDVYVGTTASMVHFPSHVRLKR